MGKNNVIRLTEGQLKKIVSESVRRMLNEAENGGWVVENDEAWDAYEYACQELGREEMADSLAAAMGSSQLAEIMAYIFRMHDLEEWYDLKDGEKEEEDW